MSLAQDRRGSIVKSLPDDWLQKASIDVSIVIVSWNTRDLLRDCLRSIVGETHVQHEIIVVDNASNDETAAMVRNEFADVKLIINCQNRGFASANNQGIEVSSGRYVLLLNPDTVILEGAIDRMVNWSDNHKDVGCAGCQVLETECTIQRTCFADPGPLSLLLTETTLHRTLHNWPLFSYPEYGRWDRRSERQVDVVSGMFMLVPRRAIANVGLMDEDFFVYSEEADWCRRFRNAGYRCVFTPVARILHRDGGGKSTTQIKPRMYVQLQKSKLLYVRKQSGAIRHTVAKCILLTSMLLRVVIFAVHSRITASTESQARAHLARTALRFHVCGVEPT